MNRRQLYPIAILLVILVAIALPLFAHEGHGKGEIAPFDLDTPRKVSPETAAHIGLQTAEVDFGKVEEIIRLTGIVRPVPDLVQSVASLIDGAATRVLSQVGDVVEQGDLLVEIHSPQLAQYIYELRKLETEYYQLQSELARARSSIDEISVQFEAATEFASIADAEFSRLQDNEDAVATNLLSEKQVAAVRTGSEARLKEIELSLSRRQLDALTDQAEAMVQSQAALQEVIASIRNDNRNGTVKQVASGGIVHSVLSSPEDAPPDRIGVVRLYSPINGVVIKRHIHGGQGVEAGQTLFVIAEYSRVQIEGELPESLVARLDQASGNQVRIRRASSGENDLIGTGTVRFISPVIDPIKRTTHVVIEADNPTGSLRDGLFVDLSIVLREEPSAVVVPASAVVVKGPMHFVFVKDGDFYKKQDINPGYSDDQFVEVLDGVFPGDVVVTRGAYSLTQLRPKLEEADTDEDTNEETSESVENDNSRDSG
ncbi:MAG: efflux RND transporter periplasmic adaptor subunit [Planctomycetota bacterium]|nr:efflux RND transporter periplasmic adaptor subunit [Planctomycetota bacterium]